MPARKDPRRDPGARNDGAAARLEVPFYFPDEGCDLHPACLSCPLPQCRYDGEDHQWAQQTALEERDAEIARLRRIGLPLAELVVKFGLSERSIHRVLAERRAA